MAAEPDAGDSPSQAPAPATLFANAAWTIAAQAAAIALGGGLAIFAIRTLSVDEWGRYSTALALVAILAVFADLGIPTLVLRQLSEDRAAGARILATGLGAVVVSAIPAMVLALPIALVLGYGHDTLVLVAIGTAIPLVQPALSVLRSAFTAHRLLRYAAVFDTLQALALVICGVTLILVGLRASALMIATVAGNVAGLAMASWLIVRILEIKPTRPARPRAVTRFIRLAAPTAGVGLVSIVYARLDVLLLSKLATSTAVAEYSVAYTVVRYSWLLPSVIASAFFPLLAELLRRHPSDARDSYLLLIRMFFFFSLPMAIFLAAGSETLLPLVFGDAYNGAADVLRVMAWTSVLGFQSYALWYGVLACHKEGLIVWVMLVGLALNLVLNLVLIPPLGPTGAAIALLVSDAFVIVVQFVVIGRQLFAMPYLWLVRKPALALLIIAGPTVALSAVSPLTAATMGSAGVMVILHRMRYIRPGEWAPVTQPLLEMLGRLRLRAA